MLAVEHCEKKITPEVLNDGRDRVRIHLLIGLGRVWRRQYPHAATRRSQKRIEQIRIDTVDFCDEVAQVIGRIEVQQYPDITRPDDQVRERWPGTRMILGEPVCAVSYTHLRAHETPE